MSDSIGQSVSLIVVARNAGHVLGQCLAALTPLRERGCELIVVDDCSIDDTAAVAQRFEANVLKTSFRSGPAVGRNLGAQAGEGEILVFVDADVIVSPTAVMRLIEILSCNPDVAAAVGSYDDAPVAVNLVSQFRNLLHHYVHQTSRRQATTFWSGCGAIRKSVFCKVGGFDPRFRHPSVEDIELGVRLHQAGHSIVLEPSAQVKHAKPWSLMSMLSCDFWSRGLPWTRLILSSQAFPNDLNLKYTNRLSVFLTCLSALFLAGASFVSPTARLMFLCGVVTLSLTDGWTGGSVNRGAMPFGAVAILLTVGIAAGSNVWAAVATALVGIVVMCNISYYTRMHQLRGWSFALLCVPLQVLHYLACGLSFACGLGAHFLSRRSVMTSGQTRRVRSSSSRYASRHISFCGKDSNEDCDPVTTNPMTNAGAEGRL